MALGKLPVPGRPTILITVGQGPIALAVGTGGGGLDIFTLIYPFSSFSLSLGDGPILTEILSQRAVKQTNNQLCCRSSSGGSLQSSRVVSPKLIVVQFCAIFCPSAENLFFFSKTFPRLVLDR